MSHIKTSRSSRLFEKVRCYFIVFVATPSIFLFEVVVVRLAIVDAYEIGEASHDLQLILATFIFMNVVGNMMMSIMIDEFPLNDYTKYEIPTQTCDNPSEEATHCRRCGVCVFKRDHHCFFFAKCIDFRNKRYYLLYLVYSTIALVYSMYYNYWYVATKFVDEDMTLAAYRLINPMLRFLDPVPFNLKELYLILLFVNFGLMIWMGSLAVFHVKNAIRGVSAWDSDKPELYKTSQWKENLLSVFGVNWYYAMICPYIDSPLFEIESED